MGIFKKDKSNKSEESKEKGDFTLTKLKDGVNAISGSLPDDFDPSNPEAVKEFLFKTLKEAGALPPDMKLSDVDLTGFEVSPKGGIATLGASKQRKSKKQVRDEASKAELLKRLHNFKPYTSSKDLPEPQDPAKRAFIQCLNQLHHKLHDLVPLCLEMVNSLGAMEMSAEATFDNKAKEKARLFDECVRLAVSEVVETVDSFCEMSAGVYAFGVPIPDAQSTTIN